MSTLAVVLLSCALKERNKELAAARALLREAADIYDIAEGNRISSGPREFTKRIRSYLDACDALGGDHVR